MKYAWIAKHKAQWPVTLTCDVLEVSASGYFEHWRRKDTTEPSKPEVHTRPVIKMRAYHPLLNQAGCTIFVDSIKEKLCSF